MTVRDGVIVDASFQTDGCSPSQAAGGMAAKMVRGKTTEEAKRYTPRIALDALGGLPEDHQHCATLAMDAMHHALEDFAAKRT